MTSKDNKLFRNWQTRLTKDEKENLPLFLLFLWRDIKEFTLSLDMLELEENNL